MGLWVILTVKVCTDLHFKFSPEIVKRPGTVWILISTYELGKSSSNFLYYLGQLLSKLGHSNSVIILLLRTF